VKTQAKKGSIGPVRHSRRQRPAESQGAAAAIALPLGSVFGAEGPSRPAPVAAAHHFFPLLLLPCDAAHFSFISAGPAATGPKQESSSFPSRTPAALSSASLDAAATEKVPPGARVRALSTTTQWNTVEHIAQALVVWERGRHKKRLLLRSHVKLSGLSALGHVLRSC
jgi:hypothetical protein